MQPAIPIQLLQLPLWLCLLLATLPALYQIVRWRKVLLGMVRTIQPSEVKDAEGESPIVLGGETEKTRLPQ